ncbi:hypothetical protein [Thioalkalivibrio sp.]|uniref:hypothetical protein n=1 Tax=Thioalkalivibrio sp. TaxID=2093813 RepID=UPI0035684C06
MQDDYRPPLADYWDALEVRYGSGFSLETITLDELRQLQAHLRAAVEQDPLVTQVEKANLGMVLKHADAVLQRRTGG